MRSRLLIAIGAIVTLALLAQIGAMLWNAEPESLRYMPTPTLDGFRPAQTEDWPTPVYPTSQVTTEYIPVNSWAPNPAYPLPFVSAPGIKLIAAVTFGETMPAMAPRPDGITVAIRYNHNRHTYRIEEVSLIPTTVQAPDTGLEVYHITTLNGIEELKNKLKSNWREE